MSRSRAPTLALPRWGRGSEMRRARLQPGSCGMADGDAGGVEEMHARGIDGERETAAGGDADRVLRFEAHHDAAGRRREMREALPAHRLEHGDFAGERAVRRGREVVRADAESRGAE